MDSTELLQAKWTEQKNVNKAYLKKIAVKCQLVFEKNSVTNYFIVKNNLLGTYTKKDIAKVILKCIPNSDGIKK